MARHDAADSAGHRGAERVVDVHEHDGLRRGARGLEDLLLVGEGIVQDHRRGREIAEHELVALLGDRRGGRDVDDVGNALLLGDLRDRGALAGVEGADQELRAVRDQLLGARARDLDVGLGVGVHDLQLGAGRDPSGSDWSARRRGSSPGRCRPARPSAAAARRPSARRPARARWQARRARRRSQPANDGG